MKAKFFKFLPILLFLFLQMENLSHVHAEIPATAKKIAGSVARIGAEVVTLRDVKIAQTLDQALDSTKELTLAEKSTDSFINLDNVSKAVLENVAYQEAMAFLFDQYDENLFKSTQLKIEKASLAKKIDLSEAKLLQLLKRKLIARHFIELRTESLKSIVNEAELKSYYEKNRSLFPNMPLDQFKESIRLTMAKDLQQKKLKEWFEVLKMKYKVRVYAQQFAEDQKDLKPK